MDIGLIEEIDDLLDRIRSRSYQLEEVPQIRLDMSVLLTMLSDSIGDVHEMQGRAEYDRKKYIAERVLIHRAAKKTAAESESLATIEAEDKYVEETEYKALYRRLENKRQALLQVCNALSAVGRDFKNDDDGED